MPVIDLRCDTLSRLREKRGNGGAFFCAETLWYLLLFVLSVASLVNSSYNPFIYFRF